MIALILALLAIPSWATKPDSADSSGHLFTCEGQGATEDDALTTAQGICSDKICKVCGVEIESIVETKETLTGVDLQRKVVERCRRVRKSEPKLRAKSVDCDPAGGCSAWIQIFYSKEDEKAECSTYTREDFTDPAACEADIQKFRTLEGYTSETFRQRTRALDEALLHCAKIDVRPTPAILALDEKLRAGLGNFESGAPRFQAYYLPADAKLHQQIAESKLLVDRIRLARDYVANKALLFGVIEALEADDHDSPAGIGRLIKALEATPRGTQYGVEYDIAFTAANSVYHWKTDTTPLCDFIRSHYAPDALTGDQDFSAAKLFADKGHISQAEWDWQYAAYQKHYCPHCLRTLLQVTEPQQALAWARLALPEALKRGNDPLWQLGNLIGYSNPKLALLLEPFIGTPLTWRFSREVLTRFDPKSHPAVPEFVARAANVLATDPKVTCVGLADDLQWITKNNGPAEVVDKRVCDCLTGELRHEVHLSNRDDLLLHAQKRALACTKGLKRFEE